MLVTVIIMKMPRRKIQGAQSVPVVLWQPHYQTTPCTLTL